MSEYQFSLTQPTDEHFGQARIDHRFASGDSLSRPLHDLEATSTGSRSSSRRSRSHRRARATKYLTVEHRHLFAPHLLATFKGG